MSHIVVLIAPVGQHRRRDERGRITCIIGCRVELLIGLRVRLRRRIIGPPLVLMGWKPESRKREYSRKTGRQDDRMTGPKTNPLVRAFFLS